MKVATIRLDDGDDLVLAPGAHLKCALGFRCTPTATAWTNCFRWEMYPSTSASRRPSDDAEEVKKEEKGDDDDDDAGGRNGGEEENAPSGGGQLPQRRRRLARQNRHQ